MNKSKVIRIAEAARVWIYDDPVFKELVDELFLERNGRPWNEEEDPISGIEDEVLDAITSHI